MFQSENPPPDGLGPDDLAAQLLTDMGIGRTPPNLIAASEAIRLKGTQPKFTFSTAYTFIVKRWTRYKASAKYNSMYRTKAAAWLSEGDYDNPASWGDTPDLAHQGTPRKPEPGPREWAADKLAHPEKYAFTSDAERIEFRERITKLIEAKRL